jgi:hypothetical protein
VAGADGLLQGQAVEGPELVVVVDQKDGRHGRGSAARYSGGRHRLCTVAYTSVVHGGGARGKVGPLCQQVHRAVQEAIYKELVARLRAFFEAHGSELTELYLARRSLSWVQAPIAADVAREVLHSADAQDEGAGPP